MILFDFKISFWKEILFFTEFFIPKISFKENFLPHPHKAATHNACALVRAMASNLRERREREKEREENRERKRESRERWQEKRERRERRESA